MNMYLRLFHGRDTLEEDMDDWGFDGPIIGPLQFCHQTYCTHICIRFLNPEDKQKWFKPDPYISDSEVFLDIKEGCVKYRGKYYGDWSCFMKE